MGEVKGFIKYKKNDFNKQKVEDRINHWDEFTIPLVEEELRIQGARCMDCGIPFCQSGCPISNIIPDWNDLVYKGNWQEAYKRLKRTNNFPEFTGRVCPAPCENSCTLAINKDAVTIKNIEVSIIEKAFNEGWINSELPNVRSGKKIAIVGSGPAGLACADELNKNSHSVTVFEKNEFIGGLLTLGIPNFKLDKKIVQRRVELMKSEGVEFKTNVEIGKDILLSELLDKFDAIVLAGGAEKPRDLPIEGRNLNGIYYAMEYLTQQNRTNMGQTFNGNRITAKDKNVVVIGGGDTGSDCIGTAIRQGAKSVMNLELLAQPPAERSEDNPWPQWALIERKSTSHEEGCDRIYSVMTKKFTGENGNVKKLHAIKLQFGEKDPRTGRKPMSEIIGSDFTLDADLVLLAMGFTGPVKNKLISELDIDLDERSNVKTDENRMTNIPGIFAAGDMRRGQSLVVWAINEGRTTAQHVHKYISV
ncbi:MAG: glutamate synthase subunit beta [Ignavibacteriales bacterium]|nr:glutamate synthase subunit beta [Ignavibacteriales bacterium]MCB9258368.1 glutamate synthase subunit beta [Ignavibacteriales bacterium]